MISNVEKATVGRFLRTMVQRGIIEIAPHPAACVFHPVIVIPKAEQGKLRLVIDFRGLNLMFSNLAFDLKDRTKVIRSVSSRARYFSSIDIKDAFFQIKIGSPTIKNLFSIHLMNRCFRFCRLPQGFKLSPYICQLTFESILMPECEDFLVIYMDDLLIFSETVEEHWRHVNTVLTILQRESIHIGWNKAKFCQTSIDYLGVTFSESGIRPAREIEEKLVKLVDMDCTKKSNWQVVQGLLIQYIRFGPRIPDLLTKFKGGDRECRLRIIRQIGQWTVSNAECESWVLFTDWSSSGRGYVLCTGDHQIPVVWNGKRNTCTQQRMSSFLGELDSACWALSDCISFWRGQPITLCTDSKSFVQKFRSFSGGADVRELRRFGFLLSIPNLRVEFTPGKFNQLADKFSRFEEIRRISILTEDRREALRRAHEDHFHFQKTFEHLKMDGHSWPGMRKDCHEFVQRCQTCQRFGSVKRTPPWRSAQKMVFNRLLIMDVAGPWKWPRTQRRVFVFIIIDSFSRYLQTSVVDTPSGITAREAVLKWIGEQGKPETIQTDNGSHFFSDVFRGFLRGHDIESRNLAVYMPQSNGLVEKSISTILGRLRTMQEFSNWEAMVESATRIINSSVHRALNTTPELVRYRRRRDGSLLSPQQHHNVLFGVRRRLMYLQEVALRRHLSRFPQAEPFRVGEQVWLINFHASKFPDQWIGPHVISRQQSDRLFWLFSRGTRLEIGPYHAHQLKRYYAQV